MTESNPGSSGASRITRLLDALERLAFRGPDLRATARGWQVHRPSRFTRIYRDQRFESLPPPCATCDGLSDCPDCDGSGRLSVYPDERAARR
jgi:hypothetical protein